MLKNDIELLNGSESWNRTLAQTLIPDFQPLKENSMLGSKENGYATRASSNPPPDIQSSHFTISPFRIFFQEFIGNFREIFSEKRLKNMESNFYKDFWNKKY